MVEILRQEAMEAFGERKENTKGLVKKRLQSAGPMIMLLLVVLVIIIIPAFISFRM